MEQGSTIDLFVLPEGCISNILSLTSPLDACRSAVVSSVFRSAADSDSVWEKFLPSDIHQILSSSVSPSDLPTFSSKKELFLHLSDNPLLIDGGTKTFALEKHSGKKCFMIGAKELYIVWGDTPRYWNWEPLPESRFSEVAELLDVCWLEIHGKMETRLLSPNTTYGAYLVLKLAEFAQGLDFSPAEVSIKLVSSGGVAEEAVVKSVYLDPKVRQWQQQQLGQGEVEVPEELDGWMEERHAYLGPVVRQRPQQQLGQGEVEIPRNRGDGWMELEMGRFFNGKGEDRVVEMSLMEVNGGNWKSGLIIQGIEFRPKREPNELI